MPGDLGNQMIKYSSNTCAALRGVVCETNSSNQISTGRKLSHLVPVLKV
jgi:hypothetical protein